MPLVSVKALLCLGQGCSQLFLGPQGKYHSVAIISCQTE